MHNLKDLVSNQIIISSYLLLESGLTEEGRVVHEPYHGHRTNVLHRSSSKPDKNQRTNVTQVKQFLSTDRPQRWIIKHSRVFSENIRNVLLEHGCLLWEQRIKQVNRFNEAKTFFLYKTFIIHMLIFIIGNALFRQQNTNCIFNLLWSTVADRSSNWRLDNLFLIYLAFKSFLDNIIVIIILLSIIIISHHHQFNVHFLPRSI